ncbi:GntR family transcriptional regulator [Nodularia spumigena CS-584]|jgi:GntR family transcriptional regulator|uniref:GntR family transcriptional regulator n=2 Tax=Nodularia spumigena TaxID=70799 RepID=A0A2S0Q9D0_NODSP|nr:GntR family transcriptional regulator [Nodularia spumigena]AHJ31141.1 Transcriptional regulator, GntR family [Nodularia spumigena CCY9414]AVZ31059.1 GntR family transcriptional regulator [Nodularia spumigena UHCC 0039]EAW45614.1 Transcriptional Regulator, GntR family protein [Nodularia spumigena CCY9414]MDB9382386.1 GntR family transcriptional regulator [Nodularia spumigena CS-584]MEA5527620.1 GntR family transcriptional regulator [Nodularia spumigena UHCC 0143]
MIQFRIQPDSEIPASNQLFNQIRFAIASRQYPPGYKLPSTRALAMQTGLHRNTISKVYRQLEEDGFVESLAGSGIYVRTQGHEGGSRLQSPVVKKQTEDAYKLVQKALDEMLSQGYSLNQARELFLGEIDWRLRCSAQVLVAVPSHDMGAGELMVYELEMSLNIPVQLVAMEELTAVLNKTNSATVVTSRYFISDVEAIAAPKAVRVIPLDIYDYSKELDLLKTLPKQNCVGIVSLSSGIARAAEVILHGLRGDELLIMTSQPKDAYKIRAIVKRAEVIISDQASFPTVHAAVQASLEDIIRPPKLIKVENYIGANSINLLKRELGLG